MIPGSAAIVCDRSPPPSWSRITCSAAVDDVALSTIRATPGRVQSRESTFQPTGCIPSAAARSWREADCASVSSWAPYGERNSTGSRPVMPWITQLSARISNVARHCGMAVRSRCE